MFKFLKKLFSSKKQPVQQTENPIQQKKPLKKETYKIYNSTEEMERPALSYVRELDLTENQQGNLTSYVKYHTGYQHNYQYRLSEFIQDLQSGKVAKKQRGIGEKTVEKILNQMKVDGVI